MDYIYWDNAATTRISESVRKAMEPYLDDRYGNPSSIHNLGIQAKKAIQESRKTIAKCMKCNADEVFFTSCGSEGNNWAIKGLIQKGIKENKRDILFSSVEHHSILNQIPHLESLGFNVKLIPVDKWCVVDTDWLEHNITDNTLLVSVMTVNNEIGTLQPIEQISNICSKHNVIFHTDAVQAIGHTLIDVCKYADIVTISGHKIHAPKGIGYIIKKPYIDLEPLICGGGQESGLRGGTENVANIVGLAQAMQDNLNKDWKVINSRQTAVIDTIVKELTNSNIDYISNTKRDLAVKGIYNFSVKDLDGETIQLLSSIDGVCISTHSACDSNSQQPSHVLQAMNVNKEYLQGSIRISLPDNVAELSSEVAVKGIHTIISSINKLKGSR